MYVVITGGFNSKEIIGPFKTRKEAIEYRTIYEEYHYVIGWAVIELISPKIG